MHDRRQPRPTVEFFVDGRTRDVQGKQIDVGDYKTIFFVILASHNKYDPAETLGHRQTCKFILGF